MHDFRLWRDLACTPSRPQHLVPDLAFTPSPAKAEESGTIANTCLALSRRGGGPGVLRHPVLLAAQPHPVFVGTGWPPHRGASRHPGVERTRCGAGLGTWCGAGLDTWCGAGWTPRVERAGHSVWSGLDTRCGAGWTPRCGAHFLRRMLLAYSCSLLSRGCAAAQFRV